MSSPKKIFISYANEPMAYSLKRIGRQARRLGIFDEVILYTSKDLPDEVKASPLMKYSRGGGYWIWKPEIIRMTLARFDEGDVVVYVDAGCTLRKSPDWEEYFSQMDRYDTICFRYFCEHPEWAKWGSTSSESRCWMKKTAVDYFAERLGSDKFKYNPQILSGVLFMKGKKNALLREWQDIMMTRPDLVKDPDPDEPQYEGFAGHRHDQALLTPLAEIDPNTLILDEKFERYSPDSFVWASRIRAASFTEYIVIQIRHYLRIWLGDARFERIKSLLKK